MLFLVTGFCAMMVAAHGLPDLLRSFLTLLGFSCGGTNAIDLWYDRDIDPIMNRTRNRPIPVGRIAPGQALVFGIAAELVSFGLLGLAANWLTAVPALSEFFYYVVIHYVAKAPHASKHHHRRGVGIFSPLVEWAAVTGTLGPTTICWTPPHFCLFAVA